MYRYSMFVLLLVSGLLPAYSAETPSVEVSEGFYMTGMQRDTVKKETEAMTFKGLRRETATRVLKETGNKNN